MNEEELVGAVEGRDGLGESDEICWACVLDGINDLEKANRCCILY